MKQICVLFLKTIELRKVNFIAVIDSIDIVAFVLGGAYKISFLTRSSRYFDLLRIILDFLLALTFWRGFLFFLNLRTLRVISRFCLHFNFNFFYLQL